MHLGAIALLIYVVLRALNRQNSEAAQAGQRAPSPTTPTSLTTPFWLRLSAFVFFIILAPTILLSLGLPRAIFFFLLFFGYGLGLVLIFAPGWLLWRVAVPMGGWRLSLALLYFVHGKKERESTRPFLDVHCGRPLLNSTAKPLTVSAWTLGAWVLGAERENDLPRAERLFRGLAALPQSAKLSPTFLKVGMEILCWRAAERCDWKAVAQRAARGRGRGVRLLRLLARAQLEAAGDWPRLILAWALAPSRARSYRYLRAALALRASSTRTRERPEPRRPAAGEPPFFIHTRLLADAAGGREVRMAAVARLAKAWEGEFSRDREAHFRARGLELGARNATGVFEGLRGLVLSELESIATTTEGSITRLHGGELADELARRLVNRQFESVRRFTVAFPNTGGATRDFRSPLEEWEEWLRFREAVERLEALAGREALQTAWHDGVQFAAWNWPYELEKAQGQRATWACHVMYVWVAELAEKVGDEEAARVNRNNAKITRED